MGVVTPLEAADVDLREGLQEAGLLERAAVTLGSTLDLREVLYRLAVMVQEQVSAQRCSIVLVEGERLEPAVAIGPQDDDALWHAFRDMPPIELRVEHWAALERGRAIHIDDARSSALIPAEWVDRFRLRAIALVPLHARGEPCGAMAVDWPDVRAEDPQESALLEAVGAYAGMAIHNARLHARVTGKSRALEHLVDVATALNSSTELGSVLDLVCDGFEKLLGTVHCSVNLVDTAHPLRVHTLARRGTDWFLDHRGGPRLVPPEEVLLAGAQPEGLLGPIVYRAVDLERVAGPVRPGGPIASAALFPLFGPDGLVGSVLAGFPVPWGPTSDDLETGQSLAELAAAAIGRADLHDRLAHRVRQLEILARLAEVVAGSADFDDALQRVRHTLESEMGVRIKALSGASAEMRDVIGGMDPDGEAAAAIEAWRAALTSATPSIGLRRQGDALLVPLIFRDCVQGVMLVEVDDERVDVTDEEFLLAVGAAFAEILHQTLLRRALASAERRLAVTLERERIARDLHDSAGQLVTGIGLRLAAYLRDDLAPTWRTRLSELHRHAVSADRELREAISNLLFVQVQRDGLVESLRELAETFRVTSGIGVDLELPAGLFGLESAHEDLLYRAAHEALANVERHSGATRVAVVLRADRAGARLTVTDDGHGMSQRRVAPDAPSFGLAALERRVQDAGGRFWIGAAHPRGVRLGVSLPLHGTDPPGGGLLGAPIDDGRPA